MRAFRHLNAGAWLRAALWLGMGIALLLPSLTAYADIGPKPSAEFKFTYENAPVPIVDGQLLICDDAACATSHPLEQVGPQHFSCSQDTCSSAAYGYGRYLKLVIEFEDRTRESEVFRKRAFDSVFSVTVTVTSLVVIEKHQSPSTGGFALALIFTLIVETPAAAIYRRRFSFPRSLLLWVPAASLITLPVIWFGFTRLLWSDETIIGLGEAFAIAFEAVFLWLISRKALAFKHAVGLSLMMNMASFLLGLCGLLLLSY
jgi:hypothetical protein